LLNGINLELPYGVFLFLLALQAKLSAYIGSVEEKIGSLPDGKPRRLKWVLHKIVDKWVS
jgi:hypothetical protein